MSLWCIDCFQLYTFCWWASGQASSLFIGDSAICKNLQTFESDLKILAKLSLMEARKLQWMNCTGRFSLRFSWTPGTSKGHQKRVALMLQLRLKHSFYSQKSLQSIPVLQVLRFRLASGFRPYWSHPTSDCIVTAGSIAPEVSCNECRAWHAAWRSCRVSFAAPTGQ